jgi:hypothetical protein
LKILNRQQPNKSCLSDKGQRRRKDQATRKQQGSYRVSGSGRQEKIKQLNTDLSILSKAMTRRQAIGSSSVPLPDIILAEQALDSRHQPQQ